MGNKTSTKMNRKGIESAMQLGGGFIILIMAVVFFLLFAAIFGEGKVHATIEAENAAFTCENNIVKFMGFNVPGHSDLTYNDLLLQSYAAEDYAAFIEETSKLFNKYSLTKWQISVHNSTGVAVPAFGTGLGNEKYVETCTYQLAVPCLSYQDCTLYAMLALDYKNFNPNYVGS